MFESTWWLCWAVLTSTAGMFYLALAIDAHWEKVVGLPGAQARVLRRGLRGLGWVALLISLLCCLRADRPSMAVLVWVMLLASSAASVACCLSWWPMRRSSS